MADIQDLEARIARLEALVGAQQSGGGGQPATPADWIGGALAKSIAPSGAGPLGQQAQQQAPGVAAQGFTGSSVCWCESRFVCATMNCGGSDWC